ncbi:MAG: hypothetical protein JW891_13170 [Candidatus Lokiarchaeota archaeon]|nr:hypothetical protein [Candidatus Lokiarchaeota archaeon]
MLDKIKNAILESEHILEKSKIKPIVQFINENCHKSSRIYSAFGEDSAAVYENEKYLLLTTDRIKTSFIEKSPFGAGFSSILVSVDDIYCCGGVPIAGSVIIAYPDEEKGKRIVEGICEGSKKFQVPIIRGHTDSRSNCYELSSTMIGEIEKDHYISARNAKIGDSIILASDFNGKVGKASDLYWDTVTFKSTEDLLNKRGAMNEIAEKRLANASKDVSNGGLFGTIMQLLFYSRLGANICVSDIVLPKALLDLGYTLEKYIKMYLTTSFILTVPSTNCGAIIEIFKKHGMHASNLGIITKDPVLEINDKKKSIKVIKF